MNLPFLNKKQTQKNFFLSILIKPYKIGAILFEESDNKLVILSTNETEVENNTDDISSDELLVACDKVVSFIEGSLPESSSVEKVIFSLPFDWIIETKIKPDYLDRLKTVCRSLELQPIGYLTSIEAIVHFIEKSEGAPSSAIFIEFARDRVFSYLVRAGKVLESASLVIEENVLLTCEALFRKIEGVDVLPAKIILLDYDDAGSMQQDFLSHKWSRDIPFLHVPQVVVLERGFENEATVNGVATQMELEVSSEIRILPEEPEKEEILEEVDSDEFGFLKEKDIAKEPEVFEEVKKQEVVQDVQEDSTLENVDENVSEITDESVESNVDAFEVALGVKPKPAKAVEVRTHAIEESNLESVNDETEADLGSEEEYEDGSEGVSGRKFSLPINLSAILSIFKIIKLPKIAIGGGGSKAKVIGILFAIILGFFALTYVYYNFIIHTNVVIFVDKKAINKSTPVVFTKEPTRDNEIKLNIESEEVSGDDTVNSTGQKQTGDKASGSVTIYNKTEDSKTFSKGAIVVGPNNLEFNLMDDVQIASTSSFSTTLSSASVKVQASKFGKEYNIPSASNFVVKGYSSSDFIAKNSDATTGGTSKTTTVVAQKDLDNLLSQITDKLEGQAVSKATGAIPSNTTVFPKSLSSDVTDKTYTKKAGDESGSVGISATIKFDIGEYSSDDVKKVVENLSKNEVPVTYVMEEGDSKVDVTDVKINNGESANATLKVNAVYSPKIDTKKLTGVISGKLGSDAEKQIKDIQGVTDVIVTFSGQIPFLPKIIPGNTHNINIEIKN